MKTILSVVVALGTFISQPTRASVSISWTKDTSQQFDVVITGSGPAAGLPGYGGFVGLLNSPSGFWSLDTRNNFKPRDDFQPGYLEIHNGGTLTYNGTVPPGNPHQFLQTQGYADFFPAVAPVHDGSYWQNLIPFNAHPFWYQGGSSTIDITSIPNPTDPTTWTFRAEYFATVPEPGAASFGLIAAGIFALRLVRRIF